jgi:hypothetical protein
MKKHNIFISWSGERSKLIADALYDWLPMVVQSAKPWMSSFSIDKGSRGLVEMVKALDGMTVGITCLTPENLAEPWILYEAGCLSKTVDVNDSTRLCTYLLGGLKNQDIQPPLSQFQHTSPDKSDTRRLVHTINKAVGGEEPLSEKTLDAIFDQFWPRLEPTLNAFPSAPKPVAKRPIEDMIAEILEFTRSETNRRLGPQLMSMSYLLGSPASGLIPSGDSYEFLPTPSGLKIVGNVIPTAVDFIVGEASSAATHEASANAKKIVIGEAKNPKPK